MNTSITGLDAVSGSRRCRRRRRPGVELVLQLFCSAISLDRAHPGGDVLCQRGKDSLPGCGIGELRIALVVGRMIGIPPDTGVHTRLAQGAQSTAGFPFVVV